jgi:hypothetical protein
LDEQYIREILAYGFQLVFHKPVMNTPTPDTVAHAASQTFRNSIAQRPTVAPPPVDFSVSEIRILSRDLDSSSNGGGG